MQGKQLQAGEKGEDLRDVRGGMGRIWWEDKDGEDSNPGSLDPDLMHFTPGLATEDCGIRRVWFASCVTLGDSLAVLGGSGRSAGLFTPLEDWRLSRFWEWGY